MALKTEAIAADAVTILLRMVDSDKTCMRKTMATDSSLEGVDQEVIPARRAAPRQRGGVVF